MKSLCKALLIFLCAPGALVAHDLEIKSLSCVATEDYLGADECELRIFTDGALTEKLQQDMKRGDTWTINKTYSFKNAIKAELWDRDAPDADDHLGTLSLVSPPAPVALTIARLARDGAAYDLTYTVHPAQAGSPRVRAENRLRAFTEETIPGAFTVINKKELVAGLGQRIKNPALVGAPDQALCGPLAILYLLAKNNPERYVEFAQALYRDGEYRMANGKLIKPGKHLYTGPVPKGVSPADWMMAASMRDAANLLFAFDPDDRFAGITLPGEMGAWLEGLLGCAQIEVNTSFVYGEMEALQAAADAVNSGNVAVLVIDTSVLPGQPADSLHLPDHWVVLLAMSAAGERNQFKIWSWAREYDVDLNRDDFKHCMWGAVIGYF
jgi:hypothetical protein